MTFENGQSFLPLASEADFQAGFEVGHKLWQLRSDRPQNLINPHGLVAAHNPEPP
jgi:hypothetical protein